MTDLVEPQPVFDDDAVFEPYDTISRTIRSTVITGSAGLFLSAVQNTLSKENVGAFGVVSKYGRSTAMFGT